MKRTLITIVILILIPLMAFASDIDPRELLRKVDVSHPFYGEKIFGTDKVNVFRSRDGSIILVYQARYGGDGDHSENLLKLFKFQGDKGKKLLDQNIDSVEFVQENNALKYIKGNYVATLCDSCDGWEVSAPQDIFFIPIVIDIESLTVRTTFNEQEKKAFIERLHKQSDKNIAEQLSYGNSKYPNFISKVKKQVKLLLERN